MHNVCDTGAVSDVLGSDCTVQNEEGCCRMYESKSGLRGVDLLQMEEFNHQVELEIGVLEEECSALMKNFFKELREKRKAEVK